MNYSFKFTWLHTFAANPNPHTLKLLKSHSVTPEPISNSDY